MARELGTHLGWRDQAAVCLAAGVFAPVFDLLVNEDGELVLWGDDRLAQPGGLWFALALICGGALLASLLATRIALLVARDSASRRRAMWSAGLLVAVGFGVLSIGAPWNPLERSHYVLLAVSLAMVGAFAFVPVLRRAAARHAERLLSAAPPAAVCAVGVQAAGNTFIPEIALTVRLVAALVLFGVVLLVGFWRAGEPSARALFHGICVAVLLGGLSWPTWNEPSTDTDAPLTARPNNVPRIILLVVDTLRRDAVSAFGGRVTTPEMDRLASESVIFTNAYSPAPWTLPSMISIMTGVHPFVHRALRIGRLLPPALPTMAELLAEQGYVSHSIGYNPLLGELRGEGTGAQRGFEEARFAPGPQGPHMLVSPWLYEPFHQELATYFTTEEIGQMASDWIDSNREDDFFLWVHFFDPHMPYHPETEFLNETRRAQSHLTSLEYSDVMRNRQRIAGQAGAVRELYDAEVLGVDTSIGLILDTLRKHGLFEDSLIVLVSDHGEEIFERGRIDHGHTLYNELLAVPLLIKLPAEQKHVVINDAVSTADIFSTVLEISGTKFNPAMNTARSLVPYWSTDSARPAARTLVSTGIEEGPQADAALFDGFKYIRRQGDGREELYNLHRDPAEANNVASAYPLLTRRGLDLIEKQRVEAQRLRRRWGLLIDHEKPFSRTGNHILRTLGYLK